MEKTRTTKVRTWTPDNPPPIGKGTNISVAGNHTEDSHEIRPPFISVMCDGSNFVLRDPNVALWLAQALQSGAAWLEKLAAMPMGDDLLREVQRLRSEAARAKAWLPIESAPKDRNIILYRHAETFNERLQPARVTEGYWFDDVPDEEEEGDGPFWNSMDGGFTNEHPPTHWQPLPQPPAAGAEGPES